MVSRPSSIRVQAIDALRDLLRANSPANGSFYDWAGNGDNAAQLNARQNSMASLPVAIIGMAGEDKEQVTTVQIECRQAITIVVYVPPPEDAEDALDYAIDRGIEDVERTIMRQDLLDPPLGVEGVRSLEVRADDRAIDGETGDLVGVVEVIMVYRHSIEDTGRHI